MKTKQHFLLALALFSTMFAAGQSLHIKAKILSASEESFPADYALFRNDTLVESGYSDAFSLKLLLGMNYKLQVYRNGYQTKTIHFSTETDADKKFRFEFSVALYKLPGFTESELAKTTGLVFYDTKKEKFNYRIY
jgi:hypothetical protein